MVYLKMYSFLVYQVAVTHVVAVIARTVIIRTNILSVDILSSFINDEVMAIILTNCIFCFFWGGGEHLDTTFVSICPSQFQCLIAVHSIVVIFNQYEA